MLKHDYDANYLFLGAYGNRGYKSVEVITLILCMKIKHPERVTLLKGKSETYGYGNVYGLYDEVIRKYGNA